MNELPNEDQTINLMLSWYKHNLKMHKFQFLNQQHELIDVQGTIQDVINEQKQDLKSRMSVTIMQQIQ